MVTVQPTVEDRIMKLAASLEAVQDDALELCGVLQELGTIRERLISKALLSKTGIGKHVGKLRKHADPIVSELSRSIVAKWKAACGMGCGLEVKESPRAPTAPSSPPARLGAYRSPPKASIRHSAACTPTAGQS